MLSYQTKHGYVIGENFVGIEHDVDQVHDGCRIGHYVGFEFRHPR